MVSGKEEGESFWVCWLHFTQKYQIGLEPCVQGTILAYRRHPGAHEGAAGFLLPHR